MPAFGTNARTSPGADVAWADAACSDAGNGRASLFLASPSNCDLVEAAA